MNPANDSLAERVANSVQQLSKVATELNAASDALGKAISAIDAVLQSLNIGVSTWVTIQEGVDEVRSSEYWRQELGYAKVSSRWGIAIRSVEGDHNAPEYASVDEWLFSDAPRLLRMQAVRKIPDLLDGIIKSAEATIDTLKQTTAEANQLATAVAQAGKKTDGTTARTPKDAGNSFGLIGSVLAANAIGQSVAAAAALSTESLRAVLEADNEVRRNSARKVGESIGRMASVAAERGPSLPDYGKIIDEAQERSKETKQNRGGK